MKVERLRSIGCCGTMDISLRLGKILSKELLATLVANGYWEGKRHTEAGILYVENMGLIATGSFTDNLLQVKCKISDDKCAPYIAALEELLKKA